MAELTPPEGPVSRAAMHVILSRFRCLSAVKLYVPLWLPGETQKRMDVIQFYYKRCRLSPGERAEMDRLHALAAATEVKLQSEVGSMLPPHLQ